MTKTKKGIRKEIKNLGLQEYTKKNRLFKKVVSLNLFVLLLGGIVFGSLSGAYQNNEVTKKAFAAEIENEPVQQLPVASEDLKQNPSIVNSK